jgi:hypothetical protein
MRHAVFKWVVAALLAFHVIETLATTVYPREVKCPACKESFVAMSLGSYSTFGDPERDLSDSPGVAYGGAEVCPHCLFASLKTDFGTLSDKERDALNARLPQMRLNLQNPERQALLDLQSSGWFRDKDLLGLLLARECYSLRESNPTRDMRLLLHFYYTTKRTRPPTLHAYYRRKCIDALSDLLSKKAYRGGEQAVMTYLLGEINRLDGRDEEAIRIFARAMKLAEALPRPKDEEDDPFAWMGIWAFEQTCRIQFASNSVPVLASFVNAPEREEEGPGIKVETQRNVAMQILADRDDPEAWAVLADYVMRDPWRLDRLDSLVDLTSEKLKIDPRLWTWVGERYQEALQKTAKSERGVDLVWIRIKNRFGFVAPRTSSDTSALEDYPEQALARVLEGRTFESFLIQYEVRPGDTLTSVGSKHGISVERLLELNPQIATPDKIAVSMQVRTLSMPLGWPESRVLENIAWLIRAGDTNAISFFLGWTGTVDQQAFEESSFQIGRCLSALSAVASSWRVPPENKLGANRQQTILRDCLALIHGDSDAARRLLPYVTSEKGLEVRVVMAGMKAAKCSLAKDAVFQWLRTNGCEDFDLYAGYLAEVCTTNDFAALREILPVRSSNTKPPWERKMTDYHRRDIEGVMLDIHLRDLLERSLGE